MKPITFEHLRRLVGGGRKKKDKEASFKRSDSFKRISIRKSYLDRGKKKHLQKLEVATQTVTEELCKVNEVPVAQVDSSVQVDKVEVCGDDYREVRRKETRRAPSKSSDNCRGGPGQSVIAYGQWLKGIRKDDAPTTTTGFKGAERTVIYVPASDETKLPSPVIRQLSSSPIFRKKSPPLTRHSKIPSPLLQRKESNDSAVEMFPWGDSSDVKKSPLFKRRARQTSPPLLPDSANEELCSLSISLGRIWMDAPQVMAPRSLELPRTSGQPAPVHHSLDSALKDLRDDPIVINRLQKRPVPPVARTLSSTSNTTASTGLFSSKDSGFSFSISVPKLSDFHSPTSRGGFFRKKRPKPKLSVSRDGYFKRTSGALVETRRNSIKRRSSRKKKNKGSGRMKRNKNGTVRSDLYQVVVSRPPRCLKSLKLDPMIFVPPEKRKNSIRRKQSFKIGMREIRNFNPLDAAMYATRSINESADEGLYESLPGEYDDLSDEQPLSGRISRISLREDYYDFPSNDFASATPASEQSLVSDTLSPFVSEDEEVSNHSASSKCKDPYVPLGVSPVPRRKPVRRKKSTLTHKKSITYVAKPSIMRAPSTLRRPVKKSGEYKKMQKRWPFIMWFLQREISFILFYCPLVFSVI